jgi:hypothetical protein
VQERRTGSRYNRAEAVAAIEQSLSWSEALRRLGMRAAGGNHATLQKWARRWGIPTDHFDPYAASRGKGGTRERPLTEILVRGSTYHRGHLKRRLYKEGLKQPRCELCGQGECWNGRIMSLILDHINGVSDDNRLENLRIACPNCAATLDTHCGRTSRAPGDVLAVPPTSSHWFTVSATARLTASRRSGGIPRVRQPHQARSVFPDPNVARLRVQTWRHS